MIDITPIVVALIFAGVFVWLVIQANKTKIPETVMLLAQSAVRLAQDLRENGLLTEDTGIAAAQYARKWLMEACESRGWKIDDEKIVNAVRMAYQMVYKSGNKQ